MAPATCAAAAGGAAGEGARGQEDRRQEAKKGGEGAAAGRDRSFSWGVCSAAWHPSWGLKGWDLFPRHWSCRHPGVGAARWVDGAGAGAAGGAVRRVSDPRVEEVIAHTPVVAPPRPVAVAEAPPPPTAASGGGQGLGGAAAAGAPLKEKDAPEAWEGPWSDGLAVAGVGIVLSRMAGSTAAPQGRTPFDATAHQVRVNLREYLRRLRRSLECSDECYVLGLIYIDRLLELHPDNWLSPANCHNLLLTSAVVAAKFHDEASRKTAFYADAGGVAATALDAMELDFLVLLDWRLQVLPHEYRLYRDTLRQEGQEGWCRAPAKVDRSRTM